MNISVVPGRYVVAVSGGVDSMVLLALLHQLLAVDKASWKVTVAHFDHGIRDDSSEDRELVGKVARTYGLPFVYAQGHLGAGASEAVARQARYAFLRQVQRASGAQAIMTAHHQDDVLETMLLAMQRGTGRKGLSSLRSQPGLVRPLLATPKTAIYDYAKQQALVWREDSTNADLVYKRNHLRHLMRQSLPAAHRAQLVGITTSMQQLNDEMDDLLASLLEQQAPNNQLNRAFFIQLPHAVSKEVLASWLRQQGQTGFDRKTLERLVVAAKTYSPGQEADSINGGRLVITKRYLALRLPER